MKGKSKKGQRQKNLTDRYLADDVDEDNVEQVQRFKRRNKTLQQDKILRTALMRAEEEQAAGDLESLPVGHVVQVHSLYTEVEHGGAKYLCVVRRTLTKVAETFVVVGDRVRFRDVTTRDESGNPVGDPDAPPEGVIEQILERQTVLTRAESFKGLTQHPIVANAEQMLIVVSLRSPDVKWGLVDRMIVAAQSGGLKPVVCLNKSDLAKSEGDGEAEDLIEARQVLSHYGTLGIESIQTSVEQDVGLDALRRLLGGRSTVLAGHSGVGKSSLIRAIQPSLDIRIGAISGYTNKGRHTTTSARRYPLDDPPGGEVIDTPGVKHFGLWGVTRENLGRFFPDVEAGTAPDWRRESFERILSSLETS
jgi:ribosome biogenesis GTPase